jgi:hypothetical protein
VNMTRLLSGLSAATVFAFPVTASAQWAPGAAYGGWGPGVGWGGAGPAGLGLRLWVHLRLQPDMELCDGVELSPLYYAFYPDLGLFDRLELSGFGCLSGLWLLALGLLGLSTSVRRS